MNSASQFAHTEWDEHGILRWAGRRLVCLLSVLIASTLYGDEPTASSRSRVPRGSSSTPGERQLTVAADRNGLPRPDSTGADGPRPRTQQEQREFADRQKLAQGWVRHKGVIIAPE